MKLIAPNTSKAVWWTLSALIFIGFWFIPTAGKYEGHVIAWYWLAHFTGGISTTWRGIGGLLVATIFFSSLSLLFGWLLRCIILAVARSFRRHTHDDRTNGA